MSLHEEVVTAIQREICELGDAVALSPTSVALAVQASFNGGEAEVHVRYTSLEHLKQMARKVLAGRFEADGEDNQAHQGDMFSGHLQDRYPVPHVAGQEPIYKVRSSLSREEANWNVEQLRKSAKARLRHADALQAWNDSRSEKAA